MFVCNISCCTPETNIKFMALQGGVDKRKGGAGGKLPKGAAPKRQWKGDKASDRGKGSKAGGRSAGGKARQGGKVKGGKRR